MTALKDYYKILRVDPSAEKEIIDAAYKRLGLMYHPDINKSVDSNLKFQEINEAYEVLGNSTKRMKYDSERSNPVPKKEELDDVAIVLKFHNLFLSDDLSAIDRYVAPDYISHSPGIPSNKDDWKALVLDALGAYETFSEIIDNIYKEGDRVYVETTEEFRQIAPFFGPPDFKKYRITTIHSYRVENGLIKEIFPGVVTRHAQTE